MVINILTSPDERHLLPNYDTTGKTLPEAQQTRGIEYFDSFNKLGNLGQTSAWFCLAKGEKYKEQFWQINVATLK